MKEKFGRNRRGKELWWNLREVKEEMERNRGDRDGAGVITGHELAEGGGAPGVKVVVKRWWKW